MMKQTTTKQTLYIEALPLTTDRTSGIGHMLADMVMELTRLPEITDSYTVVLFGPKAGAANALRWNFPGVTYRALPFPRRIVTLLNFLHLLPAVDRFLGAGVYVFGNFVNYPLTKKSRSITYVHDLCYLRYPEFLKPKVRRVLRTNLPTWMRRTDRIATVSADAKRELTEHYPDLAQKTAVVLNGVSQHLFYRRNAEEITAVKQKYGINSDYVLFVGNVEPRKNLERLVQAFQQIDKRYALVIVGGDGWLNEPISAAIDAARAAGCQIIRPTQYVGDEDLPALYSGAQIAVLLSIHEGFGMPLLEAMACETPVIASNIPSLREVVGEAGLYVDPLKVDDIVRGIRQLLGSDADRQKYAKLGLAQVPQFSWHNSALSLAEVIIKLGSERNNS